ncbi:MAG: cyclic nucleotide-binding domain-containing protein [Acidobacteriota bacterium]
MPHDDTSVDLDQILGLARHLEALDLLEESLHMVEAAARLDPHNRAVQLHQARLRQRVRREEERDAERQLRERFRRNAIDACHFFGLAALYRDRGKHRMASECLEIALQKEPIHPYAYKLDGRMLFEHKDYDGARAALRTARRFNPFDRWIAELLGRVEYEREHYREALEATIDAYLLLSEDDQDEKQVLEKRIRQYRRLVKASAEDTKRLFEQRQEKLQTDFDRLELQRERFLEDKARRTAEALEAEASRTQGQLELALGLRRFEIFRHLSDEHVFQLTRAVVRETYPAGTQIFDYGDLGYDIYLVEEGHILIRRPTSYGTFELATLPAGVLFGEVNFLSRVERSGEAVSKDDTRVLRIDADGLEMLMDERPDLGVKLLLSFWQGLALKLRGANQELRNFFTSEQDEETLRKLRETSQGDTIDADAQETLALLREKGLSGRELETLAKFSNVKRYPGGTYLFHEEDPGGEMYVILDGKVMISKFIPGGGTEALAILQRGDFFGEMSLLDGAPRSADAKAYQGSVTVGVFDQQTLAEVEQVDPRASIDFIQLLCQLMCQRLRELDEKITSWRIMAGVRPDDSTDHVGFEFPDTATMDPADAAADDDDVDALFDEADSLAESA